LTLYFHPDCRAAAGILSTTTMWARGTGPLPPKRWSGRGRPTTRLRRDARHQPISVKELALGLSKRAWRSIEWREGSAEPLASRFARLRVRVRVRVRSPLRVFEHVRDAGQGRGTCDHPVDLLDGVL
jgi:SRSO17 transposase